MARVLVLVWGTHCCLSVMHPAQAREWLGRRTLLKIIIIIISIITEYSP